MKPLSIALLTLMLAIIGEAAFAQNTAANLLDDLDLKTNSVSGAWTKSDAGLKGKGDPAGVCAIPVRIDREYRMRVEFTRIEGDDVVAILFPVGTLTGVVELSGWNGAAHGLARVDGLPTRSADNPATVRPGTLKNGQRHKADVQVKEQAGEVSVEVDLDGKRLFDWTGKVSQLSPHFVFKLDHNKSPGLGVGDSEVVFHSVQITAGLNKTPPAPSKGTTLKANVANSIPLSGLVASGNSPWEPFNGAKFRVGTDRGNSSIAAIPSAGQGDRGAFLKGVELQTGTIEVDLKGADAPQSSFLGVLFRGVDGEMYDAVYFRPFNFGASDPVRRKHAVQYISHPAWPWNRLRSQRPDQYEFRVTPEPKSTEWFHARIEIGERSVRMFVNESQTPSLEVDYLSSQKAGKVGLWFNGIAEYRKLTIRPGK